VVKYRHPAGPLPTNATPKPSPAHATHDADMSLASAHTHTHESGTDAHTQLTAVEPTQSLSAERVAEDAQQAAARSDLQLGLDSVEGMAWHSRPVCAPHRPPSSEGAGCERAGQAQQQRTRAYSMLAVADASMVTVRLSGAAGAPG
jgi:hypothetical protein